MYIVAVMITAVIFSVTGLGVLNLALLVNLDTQTAVQSMEDQVESESSVNIALWRINSGNDSLGTYTDGNMTSTFNDTALTLTVTVTGGVDTSGFVVSLEEDDHFQHAISAAGSISMSSYTIGEESTHRPRDEFRFIPAVNKAFWEGIADTVYTDNSRTYQADDLIDGVMIFSGEGINIQKADVENATMVFYGSGLTFHLENTIKAPKESGSNYPAMIFMDSTISITFDIEPGNKFARVEGAIFAAGKIHLSGGQFTGPIVADSVIVSTNMDFIDSEYEGYYQFPVGFSNYDSYDWPKQITLWEEF